MDFLTLGIVLFVGILAYKIGLKAGNKDVSFTIKSLDNNNNNNMVYSFESKGYQDTVNKITGLLKK